jgi:hypothetical protein
LGRGRARAWEGRRGRCPATTSRRHGTWSRESGRPGRRRVPAEGRGCRPCLAWRVWRHCNTVRPSRVPASRAPYSFEILPCSHRIQSTLPAPAFHSSPSMLSNSASVRPGGRRRQMSLRRGEAAFGPRGACEGAFFWRTATGRTPLTPACGAITGV